MSDNGVICDNSKATKAVIATSTVKKKMKTMKMSHGELLPGWSLLLISGAQSWSVKSVSPLGS